VARREKLLQDLVRLETDRRRNRIDAVRYQAKRQGLIEALEHVYGSLDDDVGPPPTGHTGLAA
jgi:hypothetical protein